jgi:uncharacterized peroxidase-related enzyme
MNHHGAGLRKLVGSADLPRALLSDPSTASISGSDRAMLAYALKLTRTPHGVGAEDVTELRAAGFDDTAILDVCQVTCYYNYVNRLADGLGVELEDFWTPEELTITPAEFRARLERRATSEAT